MSVSPSESLELVCEVSAAGGAVVWRKDQAEVKQDQRTTIVSQGTQRKLIIKKVTQQDQGSYTCETKDDRATFQVKVRGEKMPGVPKVKEISVLSGVLHPEDHLTAFPQWKISAIVLDFFGQLS